MSVAVTARAERDQRTGELPPAAPDVEAGGPVHRPSRRESERLRLHARVGVVEPWFSLLEHLAVVARPEVALTHRLAPCRRGSGHGSSLSTGRARPVSRLLDRAPELVASPLFRQLFHCRAQCAAGPLDNESDGSSVGVPDTSEGWASE